MKNDNQYESVDMCITNIELSATQMAYSYTCSKFIAEGITDITVWTINVSFTAGGGDVWGSLSL